MVKKFFIIISIILYLLACNSKTNNNENSAKNSTPDSHEKVSAERSEVNPDPLKIYSETIKSFETTDQFKVSLFETKNTFHYLIKIQYKNLEESDTLRVPNFGVAPSVEIKKGDKRPSCIIGFLDQDKKFRESKLVYFEDNAIKVHVLKHYAVSTYESTQ